MKSVTLPMFALAFTLGVAGCSKPAPSPKPVPNVGITVIKTQPVTLTTELPGRVSAVESSQVRPQIGGIIRRRLFTEGSMVRAGQLLYEIDDAPYRAAVLNARGQLARAQAAITSTQLQADRYRQLVAINAVSRQDSDNAAASAGQAKADVVAQQGALQSANINLGFTRIRAPISGRIGRSLATAGTLVQPGQADALATIQRMDHVYVDVTQSAADLLNLRAAVSGGAVAGQGPGSARVQLILPNDAVYPIEGRLQFADVTVDQTTGAVTLRATFPNPAGVLLPGLYVRARLIEGTRLQGILVPQAGISRNERGQATALVLGPDDVVAQRIVTTDRVIGDKWLVTDGLKPGDRVVVEGLINLRPGTKVAAHPAAAGSAPAGGRPADPNASTK
ncbi:membrane fusion protein, multidrug efflux system [Sphingomonas sp. YR710]|uniref:efflux RND transporter periplasmic adaptor subunit n=1 Tax=Sphingomonas sp. YR710 TaxID=1882773 RepID=UPI00087EED27|nr:efflux RND transporter periplasmic adaptor subunit [Sphingomonas sp. YR710]SDC70809.1 membrane fusion protein, multidrug efflux system [Sphingomonas sp. YR710]